jgi:hypothetical protein
MMNNARTLLKYKGHNENDDRDTEYDFNFIHSKRSMAAVLNSLRDKYIQTNKKKEAIVTNEVKFDYSNN